MTLREAHRYFKVWLDKSDGLSSYTSFLPEEIDYFLNSEVEKFIKTRMSGMNTQRAGFQSTDKRTDDLRTLVTKYSYVNLEGKISQYNPLYKVYALDYPATYLFKVGDSAEVTLEYGSTSYQTTDTMEAKIENIESKITNSLTDFLIHRGRVKPIVLHSDNQIKLYIDKNAYISKYNLIFVKRPEKLNFYSNPDAEITFLPDHVWGEIIPQAAKMALLNISDSRYSAYSQESQIVE